MKKTLKITLFSFVLLFSQNANAQYDILIKNVTVISMRQNDVLKNKDVGIANGKIRLSETLRKMPKQSKS
jgi:hypothetical protein